MTILMVLLGVLIWRGFFSIYNLTFAKFEEFCSSVAYIFGKNFLEANPPPLLFY